MASSSSEAAPLLAGAASSVITPPLGISLDGFVSKPGPAKHIHDELFARCLALQSGDTTLAVAVCDCTMIRQDVFDAAKARVAALTGLSPACLMLTATHSHSTPRAAGISKTPLDDAYLEFLSQRLADGICRAVNQLQPARLGGTTLNKPEHLHNRRWYMTPERIPPDVFGGTGAQVRMNPPRCDPGLIRPAGPTDPQVTVLSVQHADGRPLAVLANYGLHYVGGTGPGHVSADYYGMVCRLLERSLDPDCQDPPVVAILANGASGNVNNIDVTQPAVPAAPYAQMRIVAADVAAAVGDSLQTIRYRSSVRLAARMHALELAVRKPDAERLRWAEAVLADTGHTGAQGLARVFAGETLLLREYPDCVSIPLQAFAIGDLALCAVPCEVFAETGLAIRSQSPFPLTAVMSLANGYHGYLPPPEQHALGGYETWPARSSCLAVDAEPAIRSTLQALLDSLAAD